MKFHNPFLLLLTTIRHLALKVRNAYSAQGYSDDEINARMLDIIKGRGNFTSINEAMIAEQKKCYEQTILEIMSRNQGNVENVLISIIGYYETEVSRLEGEQEQKGKQDLLKQDIEKSTNISSDNSESSRGRDQGACTSLQLLMKKTKILRMLLETKIKTQSLRFEHSMIKEQMRRKREQMRLI